MSLVAKMENSGGIDFTFLRSAFLMCVCVYLSPRWCSGVPVRLAPDSVLFLQSFYRHVAELVFVYNKATREEFQERAQQNIRACIEAIASDKHLASWKVRLVEEIGGLRQ